MSNISYKWQVAMSPKSREWAPLNDTWLSIVVAVVISLLVNTISGFTWELLSVIQVIFLLIAGLLIGYYGHLKAAALEEYQKKVEDEELFGLNNAYARTKVRNSIYDKLKRSAKPTFYMCMFCLIGALVLLSIQAHNKNEFSRNELLAAQGMMKDIKGIKTWIDKHQYKDKVEKTEKKPGEETQSYNIPTTKPEVHDVQLVNKIPPQRKHATRQ